MIRRLTSSAVLVFVVCATLAGGANADPYRDARKAVESWQGQSAPVLVVLCVDGLRPDIIGARSVTGEMVMPRAHELARQSLVFDNVLSRRISPTAGFEELIRSLAPLQREGWNTEVVIAPADLGDAAKRLLAELGWDEPRILAQGRAPGRCAPAKAPAWLHSERGAVDAAIDRAAESAQPSIVVVLVDHLLLPYIVGDDILRKFDPAPWVSQSQSKERIEVQVQRRLRQVQRIIRRRTGQHGARLDPGLANLFHWASNSIHASFDGWVGETLDRLAQPDLEPRTTLIVTATSSAGRGDRTYHGSGVGVRLDVAKIPLLIRVPGATPMTDTTPHQLDDLASLWSTGGESPLLRPKSTHQDRFSFADAIGIRGSRWVEARWTTDDLTVIDIVKPLQGQRLFDLVLDPQERIDRSLSHPELAHSLVEDLRLRAYGESPTVVIHATDLEGRTVTIESGAQLTVEKSDPAQRVTWAIDRGHDTLRIRFEKVADSFVIKSASPLDLLIGGLPLEGPTRDFEIPVHSDEFLRALVRSAKSAELESSPNGSLEIWIESDGAALK